MNQHVAKPPEEKQNHKGQGADHSAPEGLDFSVMQIHGFFIKLTIRE